MSNPTWPARWPTLASHLAAWLPSRRWYPGAAAIDRLELAFSRSWRGDDGAHYLELLVRPRPQLADDLAVHLTLALRPTGPREDPPFAIVPDDSGATWQVGEALDDPDFLAHLFAGLLPDGATHGARLIAGEQSNSSVVLPRAGAIAKVFRAIRPGINPDAEVPLALWQAGFRRIPRPLGAVTVPLGDDGPATLAVLAEYVAGGQDGFELACTRAQDGRDIDQLRELGEATRQMHRALAQAFPTAPAVPGSSIAQELRARAEWAADQVPALRAALPAAFALFHRIAELPHLPRMQRTHGDFHLGQTLHVSAHGWRILDFEGEPLRPFAERVRPGLALRDIAGMLRSFDYAAAIGSAPAGWRERAEAQYLAGCGAMDDDVAAPLLAALQLDKAMYECAYEAGVRPDWVSIPLAAVQRMTAGPLGERADLD